MNNLPPEIQTSTMRPPFEPRQTFKSDQRDSTPTHRIIFQRGEKPWAIVGYEYGSDAVDSFATIGEAREALKGMVVV